MKKTSKILALVLVVAMVVAMGVGTVAFASDLGANVETATFTYTGTTPAATTDGKIVLSNSTKDTTYTLYKLFDATFSGDKVSYTTTNKNLALDADYFTIATQADANGNYAVTRTMEGTATKKTDAELITYLKGLKAQMATLGVKVGSIKSPANGEISWEKIPYGYYVIVPDKPEEPEAVVTIDSNIPEVSVVDKNGKPSWDNGDNQPGKVIIETNAEGLEQKVSTNEAKLGEDVTFDIGINATNYNGDKQVLKYFVKDTMDNGMTYKENSFTVKLVDNSTDPATETVIAPYNATTAPNGYKITYYDKNKAPTTTLSEAQGFWIELPWATTEGDKTTSLYNAPLEIHVRYQAFLDPAKKDDVKIGTNANNNKADFDWEDTKDDGDEPTYDKPKQDVPEKDTKTYTTSVTIHKTDGSKELKGAEFQLVGQSTNVVITMTESFTAWVESTSTGDKYWKLKNGTYTKDDPDTKVGEDYKYDRDLYDLTAGEFAKTTTVGTIGDGTTAVDIKAFVNEDGTLTFAGLADGDYTIKETTVPAGYNKAEDISFTISHTSDLTAKTVTFASSNSAVVLDATNGVFDVTIVNNSGSELPETGGIGTTIFYVVGAILVVGAVVILVTRRRMRAR